MKARKWMNKATGTVHLVATGWLPFLPEKLRRCFHHRVIDVGSVALGVEPSGWREDRISGLSELLSVISNREATHDALEDARDVVRLLRWLTGNYRGGAKA